MTSLLSRLLRRQPRAEHLTVTVYSREKCGCCHKALDVLREFQDRYGFTIEEVDIDRDAALVSKYDTEVPVVAVDGKVRKTVASLTRKRAEFGAVNLEGEIEAKKIEAFTQRKSALQEDIEYLTTEAEQLKALRKATKRHVTYDELPKEARFDRLSTQSKHLIDTIKIVAYRAETAMAQILRQKMIRHDDARSLLRAIYNTEADMVPDREANTLTIRLHPLANNSSDQAVRHLCEELNRTETVFPGTEMRLIYESVSSQIL